MKVTSRLSKTGGFDRRPASWRTGGSVALRITRTTLVTLSFVAASLAGAQNHISEDDVKAAYVFNFGRFVRFEPSAVVTSRASFDICIVGENPLGRTLEDITANEQLDGKPVRVIRLKSGADAHGCAIAYISASEDSHLGSDLDALRGLPVLTVSDASNFLSHGGMIQFVLVANHVRFAVNLEAVRTAQLTLSSELLKVAVSVNGQPPKGGRP